MFEYKTQKTFTEGGIAREADYSARYQLTKLASDTYQFYDFSERNATICNAKEALKQLASIRGGRALDKEITNHVLSMNDFSSITVTASATALHKTAGVENNNEPWKVVAVNGVEYFVNADVDEDEKTVKQAEEESSLTKTASVHNHIYTINIKAHNISELAKIAGFVEEKLNALKNTTHTFGDNVIAFDVQTPDTPEAVQSTIQKTLDDSKIYLSPDNVQVHNDSCPCGCGTAVQPVQPEVQIPEVVEEQLPQMQQGQFVLVIPATTMMSYASDLHTLKKYASSHYKDYKIYNDKNEVVAVMKDGIDVAPEGPTFKEALAAFLDEQIAKTAADGKVEIFDQSGTKKADGTDVQQGDTVVNPETGVATKIKETVGAVEPEIKTQDVVVKDLETTPRIHRQVGHAAVEPNLSTTAEEKPLKEMDPNEKPSEETKAKGDDDVKRWKGMREDPSSGKYVVYITETEEHIFDNPDDAINFLVRK